MNTQPSRLIVNFAPTGMIPTKAMTPHVPVSVPEIVDDVLEACELGITMVHVHARDEATGEPTYRSDVYARIIAGILILQHPLWSTVLVPTTLVLILGIQGLIIGIVNLIQAFRGGGWGIGILGALSIVFGIILLSNLFVSAAALPFVAGAFGVVGGRHRARSQQRPGVGHGRFAQLRQ